MAWLCCEPSDTEVLYTRATQEVADEFGRTFTWDLKVRQMGLPSMELARLIVGELALPMTEEQYLERVSHIHRQLFPTASLMPGTSSPISKRETRSQRTFLTLNFLWNILFFERKHFKHIYV